MANSCLILNLSTNILCKNQQSFYFKLLSSIVCVYSYLNKSKPPLITFSTTVEAETNKESFVILVYDSVNLYLALVVHSLCQLCKFNYIWYTTVQPRCLEHHCLEFRVLLANDFFFQNKTRVFLEIKYTRYSVSVFSCDQFTKSLSHRDHYLNVSYTFTHTYAVETSVRSWTLNVELFELSQ